MFSKKKKKLDISLPKNFEHRVHTGFDKRENRYVGLPPQWAGIVSPTPSAKGALSSRPTPLIDPSEITPTEVLDLKVKMLPQELQTHNKNPYIPYMTFRPLNHDRNLGTGFPQQNRFRPSSTRRKLGLLVFVVVDSMAVAPSFSF
jgi:hypothetical protein